MTLREADEAAQRGLTIIHRPPGQAAIEYRRITATGYRYNDKHERTGFVQLLDFSERSVINADPGHCELVKRR